MSTYDEKLVQTLESCW